MIRIGYGESWIIWMNVLVFTSSILVIVNDRPTKEFKMERGLRQGDPISLFCHSCERIEGLFKYTGGKW